MILIRTDFLHPQIIFTLVVQQIVSMLKKRRKQRVVKGRYVDIDSVDVASGTNYSNWITITKHKLKERELKLLQIKINTTGTVINQAISDHNILSLTTTTFKVTEKTTQQTLKHLYNTIDEWNGVNTSRTKSTLNTFRDYFTVAKKWFDSAKKKQIGKIYWLLVLQQIKQLPIKAEMQLHLIKALFHGTIKYNNTKCQSLISGGSIMCCKELQQFLYSLHPTLKIKEWIKEQKMCTSYQQNSSKLIYKIQSQLHIIINTNQVTTPRNINAYGGVHNVSNAISRVRYTPFVASNVNQSNLPTINLPDIRLPLINNVTIPQYTNNNNSYAIILNQPGNNPQIYFV
eukprot:440829_1